MLGRMGKRHPLVPWLIMGGLVGGYYLIHRGTGADEAPQAAQAALGQAAAESGAAPGQVQLVGIQQTSV